jgi:hypothetical protein
MQSEQSSIPPLQKGGRSDFSSFPPLQKGGRGDFSSSQALQNGGRSDFPEAPPLLKGHVIRMIYSQPSFPVNEYEGSGKLDTYYNYFFGKDSTKWASFVPLYREVIVKSVWAGIDVRYYFEPSSPPLAKGGQGGFSSNTSNAKDVQGGFPSLRYDFIVAPGADISQIRMQFEGQDALFVNDAGELVIKTSVGDVCHSKLYAYQEIQEGLHLEAGAHLCQIDCRFVKYSDGSVGFAVEGYNPALALVIDPYILWATYLGGSGYEDYPMSSAIDKNNNIYIKGVTTSSDYPVTVGAYDSIYCENTQLNGCIFVTKINSNGSALLYSTFLETTGYYYSENIVPGGIVVDSFGNAYIVGNANNEYPTTQGVYKETIEDNGLNIYVTKLNPTGSSLVFSTFIGRAMPYQFIAVDNDFNVYIAGSTETMPNDSLPDYPVTAGAYDTSYNGNITDTYSCGDIFITKINPNGTALIYSTFLGGNSIDKICGLAIDSANNAIVSGVTRSYNFPLTDGAYTEPYTWDTTWNNWYERIFVTKLNAEGSGLVFSSVFGKQPNIIHGFFPFFYFCIDKHANIFLAGSGSLDYGFTTTPGAYRETPIGMVDIFVMKLNHSGSYLDYSTIFGTDKNDECISIAIDTSGNACIVGVAHYSQDSLPIVGTQFFKSSRNSYIFSINNNGSLVYSSYFYFNSSKLNFFIDNSNNYYLVSQNKRRNKYVVTTNGAFQEYPLINQGYTIHVMKIGDCPGTPEIASSAASLSFHPAPCSEYIEDTLWVRNSGDCTLVVEEASFSGRDSSQFSVTEPDMPFFLSSLDSVQLVVRFTPNSKAGAYTNTLSLFNNTTDSLYNININVFKDSLVFKLNGIRKDTIVIDFDSICPNTAKDTIIEMRNWSSIPTSFEITDLSSLFTKQETGIFNFASNETKNLHLRFNGSADTGVYKDTFNIIDICNKHYTVILKSYVTRPIAFTGNDTTVCYSSSIVLGNNYTSGVKPYTYSWQPASMLENPDAAYPTTLPLTAETAFIVTVTDRNGCSSSDTVVVNVDSKFTARASNPITVCHGGSAKIGVNHWGGKAPYTYNWLPEALCNDPTLKEPTVTADTTTMFHVLVTDKYNCQVIDSVLVTVNPKIYVAGNKTFYTCPNVPLKLTPIAAGGSERFINFSWTPSSGLDNSTIANPSVTHSILGVYKYILSVTDSKLCVGIDTITVEVIEQPQLSANLSELDFGSLSACVSSRRSCLRKRYHNCLAY